MKKRRYLCNIKSIRSPIIDAFKDTGCECPICTIQNNLSERLVSQYLNEAVMEPVYRIAVNEKGFCGKHFADLFAGQNKLGLALQVHTRTDAVIKSLTVPKNHKEAKKAADKISNQISTCVICEQMSETLELYYATCAQLFASDRAFSALLLGCRGFCLEHYAGLLRNSSYAGKLANEYLLRLSTAQTKNMLWLNDEVQAFADRFDYRAAQKNDTSFSKSALPRAINKLVGRTIDFDKEIE